MYGSKPTVLGLVRAALVKNGGAREGAGRPSNEEISQNNVMTDLPKPPATLFDPPAKPEPKEKPPQQGTSKAYTLQRIAQMAPHLLPRIDSGELSANAAAINLQLRKCASAKNSAQSIA